MKQTKRERRKQGGGQEKHLTHTHAHAHTKNRIITDISLMPLQFPLLLKKKLSILEIASSKWVSNIQGCRSIYLG